MNTQKFDQDIKEVIENASKQKDGYFTLMVNKKPSILGFSEEVLYPQIAIAYVKKEYDEIFMGNIGDVSISNIDARLTIGVQLKEQDKFSIYIDNRKSKIKLNQKTEINDEDKLILYWEYGNSAVFFMIYNDIVTNSIKKQTIYHASDLEGINFLRYIVTTNLLPTKNGNKLQSALVNYFNNDLEDTTWDQEA